VIQKSSWTSSAQASWIVLACATLFTSSTWAQGIGLPDPSPEIRRQAQRQEQLRRDLELKPDVKLGDLSAAGLALLPNEQPCRPIAAVVFEGPDHLQRPLQKALAGKGGEDSPLGRCLGVQGIAVLIDRARNALIAQGYITSRIEAPPQDLTQGRLLLRVLVGRVAHIDAGESGRAADQLAPLAREQALNLRDIEQSLENLRRNPSAQADFQLRPGAEADTTDIALSYTLGRPIRLNLSLDDSGSTSTGKLMAQATVSWDSPLGLSDLAYVSLGQDAGRRQAGPRGNDSQTLHYSLPWGYWLWSVTASRSDYHQTIAGAFQSYLYSGQTQSQDLQLSRVVHRDSDSKTSLQLRGFSRRSRNFIDDTEVQVQRRQTAGWEAALQHAQRLGQLSGDLQLVWRRGTGAFSAMRAPEERFGEGSSRMQVGTGILNLQWPVPLPGRLSASHHLRVQHNRTPLVPQDRLCLGGRSSVRGFDGRQALCGDRGHLSRNELSLPLNESVSLYAGIDFGRVAGRSTDQLPDRFLSGYALGLRGQHRLGSELSAIVDAFVGRPITKPAFLTTASSTAGFSLNLNF
jgi:hemolysin activation/secretion protein